MEARTLPPKVRPGSARLDLRGPRTPSSPLVLTPEALAFVAELARRYTPRVQELLARRRERQAEFDGGRFPDYLPETVGIRTSEWTVAPIPPELQDRRVEITGPVDRKMVINGLSSGANVYMADFEDATSPTWQNLIEGQQNLVDAVRGTIRYVQPDTGKIYTLGPNAATLFVRPRGWHLWEKHVLVEGQPVPAALFDVGLYFWHNAAHLVATGRRPCFYLPKMESHREARLWAEVFAFAEEALEIPPGTVRATVLIETLPAAFQMDEILWELRAYSAGLNCGRWDYIFSYIKTFAEHAAFVVPDRGAIGMDQPFLAAYSRALVMICHRRGIHAMGGMAAQVPLKDDPVASALALDKVRADKLREVKLGHDGTWVAHPALVPVAREVFDAHMPGPNQLHVRPPGGPPRAFDLCAVPQGPRTTSTLRHDIDVCVRYLEAWLRGVGSVALYGQMEDAATVEIARSQIWQWIRHGARLSDGTDLTLSRFERLLDEEMTRLRAQIGAEAFDRGRWAEARALFQRACTARRLPSFVTSLAYERIVTLLPPSME
ncbi:MAG: malate synthase A [Pseudomonadota bacterium]|nr:malate synthase A [Pseudomonadota bacterium]